MGGTTEGTEGTEGYLRFQILDLKFGISDFGFERNTDFGSVILFLFFLGHGWEGTADKR